MSQIFNEELEKHKEITWENYIKLKEDGFLEDYGDYDEEAIYFVTDVKSQRELINKLYNDIQYLKSIITEMRGD